MYLGNLAHTSNAANESQLNPATVPALQQLWKTNVNAVIASGITVSNGSLYFGAWDGNFYSVDSATGNVAWSTFVGVAPDPGVSWCQSIGVSSQAVVSGDTVYVGGGDSAVYALDRNTGEVRWRVQLADPQTGAYLWASMMLSQNSLYVGIASLGDCPLVRAGLARMSLSDPTHPLIKYLMPENQQGASIWTTPAIDEQANLVYVTTGNAAVQDAEGGVWGSALIALDATTLDIKAHFFLPILPTEDDADWGSSPMLFQTPDGQQYVAASGKNGMMYVLHRPDLSLAWSYHMSIDCDSPTSGCGSVSTPAFDGQTIYAGAGQSNSSGTPPGNVYALDAATQKLRWNYAARGIVLAPVTLSPGLIYVPTTNGLSVLDTATGTELWHDSGATGLYGQVAVSNGVLYAPYINGDLVAWGVPSSPGGDASVVATPGGLTFRFTNGGPTPATQGLNVYATSSGGVDFSVASDSAWLSTDVQSGTTPAQITVQVNVTGMAPGTYTGMITIGPSSGNPVTVSVKLLVNGSLPPLADANVANAASFQTGLLAPGGLFTIISANLGGETINTPLVPWPTTLGGVSVKFNGIAAPLMYVSPTQINAQVPYEVPPGAATLTVESNGAATAPLQVNIMTTAPGIFLTDGTHAAAINQDLSINTAATPAPTGSVVALYFTGQGKVDNTVNSGAPAPKQILSNTTAPTTATIGGIPADVLFSGLAPGYVGSAQANVRVPDLPAGDYPVILTVGGVASNAGILSVTR